MVGSAKVEMKGPRVSKADIRTHLFSSFKSLTKIGARIEHLDEGEQAQDIDITTSAQAFRTLQISSLHNVV